MSHLDITACSRKHQHPRQFEWNREKAGSSHSLNLLFKVLTHYQLRPLKSCAVGCWLGPVVLAQPWTIATETRALGFKGGSPRESFSIGECSILFFRTETGENPLRAVSTPSADSLHLRVKTCVSLLAAELMCRRCLWTMSEGRRKELPVCGPPGLLTTSGRKPAGSSKSRTRG